jgi:hypothetical protein
MPPDTSPHRWCSPARVTAQCAGLTLAYSRRALIQYYPRFTRFEAKHFLLEAVRFNDGSCPLRIFDNTSVVVVAGSGPEAVIAPEMTAFARALGFGLRAHHIEHPDRIERLIARVKRNFLVGRSFTDFDDLNHHALTWCREVVNKKPKRGLGTRPRPRNTASAW